MKKGFIDIIKYYSTGIGLIYIIYVVFGDSETDAMAPYHYAIIGMYFCCVFWLFSSFRNYFLKGKKTAYQKVVLFLNLTIIVWFTFWVTSP